MCAWKTKQKVLFILLCRIVFLFSMPITAKQGGEKSAVVFGGVMEYSTDVKGEAHIAERKIMCMDFSVLLKGKVWTLLKWHLLQFYWEAGHGPLVPACGVRLTLESTYSRRSICRGKFS